MRYDANLDSREKLKDGRKKKEEDDDDEYCEMGEGMKKEEEKETTKQSALTRTRMTNYRAVISPGS